MERQQFTFHASFANAIQRIKEPAERAAAYDAIVNYALYGDEPDLDGLSDAVCLVFDFLRPALELGRKKAQGGKEGRKTPSRPKEDPNKTPIRPREDYVKTPLRVGEDSDKTHVRVNEDSVKTTPETLFAGDLLDAVKAWLAYKQEKHQPYKPTGLATLFNQIRKSADEYGDSAMADVIRSSMASNYMGIMWGRLSEKKSSAPNKITTAATYTAPNASAAKYEKMMQELEAAGLGG